MHQCTFRSSPDLGRSTFFRRSATMLLVLGTAFGLAACSSVSNKLPSVESVVSPFKIDIVQGNVVTREQSQALRPGMSRDHVRDLLGSPLLTSVFHADRWDYVFTFRRQGQATQNRRLTVFFKDSGLERFESDELPSEAEFVAALDSGRQAGKAPSLEATEAQLKAFDASNKSAAAVKPVPAPSAPAAAYPPLEAAGAAK